MNYKDITIGIVTYKSEKVLFKCLKSIKKINKINNKKGAFDFVTKKNLRFVLFLKFNNNQKIIDIIIIAIVKCRDNL